MHKSAYALLLAASFVLIAPAVPGRAETHTLTLRQTIDAALQQNPDIALARLDEEKARHAVRESRDPFFPRVVAGSGLAWTDGFPMSIEGSAPTVLRVDATQYLFNRQQSYAVAQARENARGASFGVAGKRDEVAYRAAELFLDAERAGRMGPLARRDADSLQKVLETVREQVREGRALPLAEKQADYQVARARALAANMEEDRAAAESALAMVAGFPAGDRVEPASEERTPPALPSGEEAALKQALESNKDLKRLESQILAKQIEIRSEKAARLPRADLVAQYGLLAKFNNYDEFFNRFQRHNGQVGLSLQLPVFTGPGVSAQVAQTTTEISRLRIEYNQLRGRIRADIEASFREVRKAEASSEVARLDLDVAREQLSVILAQMQEGRASLRQVEEARMVESAKWMAFHDARHAVEKARWGVLRMTGDLATALP